MLVENDGSIQSFLSEMSQGRHLVVGTPAGLARLLHKVHFGLVRSLVLDGVDQMFAQGSEMQVRQLLGVAHQSSVAMFGARWLPELRELISERTAPSYVQVAEEPTAELLPGWQMAFSSPKRVPSSVAVSASILPGPKDISGGASPSSSADAPRVAPAMAEGRRGFVVSGAAQPVPRATQARGASPAARPAETDGCDSSRADPPTSEAPETPKSSKTLAPLDGMSPEKTLQALSSRAADLLEQVQARQELRHNKAPEATNPSSRAGRMSGISTQREDQVDSYSSGGEEAIEASGQHPRCQ